MPPKTKTVVEPEVELVGRQPELLASIDCSSWDEPSVDIALIDRGLSLDGSLEQKKARLSGNVVEVFEAEGERARTEAADLAAEQQAAEAAALAREDVERAEAEAAQARAIEEAQARQAALEAQDSGDSDKSDSGA